MREGVVSREGGANEHDNGNEWDGTSTLCKQCFMDEHTAEFLRTRFG